ncbi:MAG: protein translocase subunit SecD [Planctomycetota bacterium]|jgi:SecD/SecF fusion protein
MSGATAKRFVAIALILGLAIWSIVANDVVLGLDLRGGVTMRYELETPDTVLDGADTADSMIDSTVETLNQRIDAYGIRESSITRQGTHEIVIELPGSGSEESETIKSVIAQVGRLEWRILAADDLRTGLNVEEQRQRLAELLGENIGKLPDEIDVTTLDLSFPDVLYRWVPYSSNVLAQRRGVDDLDEVLVTRDDGTTGLPPELALRAGDATLPGDYELLRIESGTTREFTGADIQTAYEDRDSRGFKAVGVTIKPDRASAFGDFSEEYKGRQLAIVLDGRLAQPPAVINDRLEGRFVIQAGAAGGFKDQEIKDYLTVIRSGSLELKPRLLYENTIGPSLGESSIRSGTRAGILALIVTVVFMIGYYRWHGVHAAVTLLANLLALAGLLMLLGATLTLPGMAGLVLTLGMAVDANILIYERMREEADRAKSPAQVIKLGFEKALSTIVDSNITTFITALILYKVGSGPVRGFAVVLMLGILTSVWAALFVGRTMYDALVESGRMKVVGKMGRLVKAGVHIDFMRFGQSCLRVSAIAVVGGLLAFIFTGEDKYGLDFLGGYKAHVRLATEATQGEVKAAVDKVFPGAQVVSIASESASEGRSRQFVIKVKEGAAEVQAAEDSGALERYETGMKAALGDMLLPDFFTDLQLTPDNATATTAISGTLNFEAPVQPDAIAARLGFLSGKQVQAAGPNALSVQGSVAGTGLAPKVVAQRFKSALSGTLGLAPLSEPLVESTTIGSRVGTELRDSASRALLLSFLAIVIYIRVRFREYRFGFAAVCALVHDVLITLGVVSLAHLFGIVDIELDLAMIAAFLTIIGYSLNDTIVLFDRIRENTPRMDRPLAEVINTSVNQVLARSLLTSITVLLTLLVIFFMNVGQQNVLEGFSFAMIVGVIVGTYSSIYVASPLLVLFSKRAEGKAT